MDIAYVQELKDQLDGPSCHVCGAIMTRHVVADEPGAVIWNCLSCGATTDFWLKRVEAK